MIKGRRRFSATHVKKRQVAIATKGFERKTFFHDGIGERCARRPHLEGALKPRDILDETQMDLLRP